MTPVPRTMKNGGKTRRCMKIKEIRVRMIPASQRDSAERENLSREMERIIALARRHGGEVDPGLVRAKEAIDDRESHLLVARSRWGDLLGGLSYTFPDPGTLRVDYIGMKVHRCGIGTRLMVAVAEIALRGHREIRLTAQKGAKEFFGSLGMEMLEEFHDGNSIFGFSEEGMKRLLERYRGSL